MRNAGRASVKSTNEKLAEEMEAKCEPFNRAMPLNLTIETTMHCNSRCIMCQVYRNPTAMKRANLKDSILPFDVFGRIAKETFPTAKTMSPTVMGEPLLTPYLQDMMGILDRYSVMMNIVTNGTLLTENVSRMLMPHLLKIKISFDGATKSTFEKIRRGSSFELVKRNVIEFNKIRNEMHLKERPTLILQATLMKDNIKELPDIVELAHSFGVDMVVGLHVYVFDSTFKKQSLFYHREIANEYLQKAKNRAEELGIAVHLPNAFNRKIEPSVKAANVCSQSTIGKRCKFLWREVWISNKGDVTPCCVPNRPVMGNIHETSFKDIWNNGLYQEMRKRLNTDDPYACCRNCSLAVQYEPQLGFEYDKKSFFLF